MKRYDILFAKAAFAVTMLSMVVIGFTACSPDKDHTPLGNPPVVKVSATPIPDMTNRWLIVDETPGAFIHQWSLGEGTNFSGKSRDTAYYPFAGTYTLKLTSFNRDGRGSDSLQIVVAEDDPDGCAGPLAFLTDCGTKTWVLAHAEPGALWVGSPEGQQWWASGSGDVTERHCLFNDEYTFTLGGDYIFENHGDLWVDDEGGPWPADIGLPVGCADFTQVPAQYQAWGSGSHRFTLSSTHLTVQGEGAFIGLYKAGNNAITAVPETSISYEIVSITENKLVIRKAYDWGTWQFTLVPKD